MTDGKVYAGNKMDIQKNTDCNREYSYRKMEMCRLVYKKLNGTRRQPAGEQEYHYLATKNRQKKQRTMKGQMDRPH